MIVNLVTAFKVNKVYAAWEGEGIGTEESPYQIGTASQLNKFRDIVNGINGETQNVYACAELTANINLEGSEGNQWVPIGTFDRGTLDKRLTIYLDDFSLQAVKMIVLLGGHAKKIK